ncbi:acyl-CoA thioesterase [Aestuariivita boseongensis]|uniref:acyl-CoA thioesterase n=1 Tax=Aestuariivita boseongensis TaxID=1470562 RepID=UPI00067FB77A|nr:thioesterase family protein [Aestuariivita boseongensis]
MSDVFEHVIRVGWGDCDPARIAYTARIPAWALESIDAWWEHHLDGDGWFQMETDRNVGTPFVNLSMDFVSPITPRHRLRCKVWPTKLGSKSITFRVEGAQDGTTCFTGSFTCVFTIADQFKSQPAPDDLRAIVEPLMRP